MLTRSGTGHIALGFLPEDPSARALLLVHQHFTGHTMEDPDACVAAATGVLFVAATARSRAFQRPWLPCRSTRPPHPHPDAPAMVTTSVSCRRCRRHGHRELSMAGPLGPLGPARASSPPVRSLQTGPRSWSVRSGSVRRRPVQLAARSRPGLARTVSTLSSDYVQTIFN